MGTTEPRIFEPFIDATETNEATLLVLNRTEPAPLLDLLKRTFDRQPLAVVEQEIPGPVTDEVLLLDASGVIANSQLEELARGYLMINADRYRTGTNDLAEEAVPAVLRELSGLTFELRGYPESVKEKLLLIVLSRFVEARALRVDAGELRVGFGRLSRLDDELGTRGVYERLGASGVETHLYGIGSETTNYPDGLVVHEGEDVAYKRSWFLVFEPPEDEDAAALLARKIGDNEWRGTWTFDTDVVHSAAAHVRERF